MHVFVVLVGFVCRAGLVEVCPKASGRSLTYYFALLGLQLMLVWVDDVNPANEGVTFVCWCGRFWSLVRDVAVHVDGYVVVFGGCSCQDLSLFIKSSGSLESCFRDMTICSSCIVLDWEAS